MITKCIDNAAYFHRQLLASPRTEVITVPEISSVVFRVLPGASGEDADTMNKRVRRELLHHHGIVIGQTVCRGNVCLKFTLLNPRQTPERLDELLALILKLADRK